jgi:hypothetical protein
LAASQPATAGNPHAKGFPPGAAPRPEMPVDGCVDYFGQQWASMHFREETYNFTALTIKQ